MPIEGENIADSAQGLPIEGENIADSAQGLPIEGENIADSAQGLPIEGENIADSAQNVPTKLSKLTFDSILMSMNYNEMTRQNLSEIYKKIELNQIINSSYVAKIMECSERTARNLMNKLKDMGVLMPIAGKGKGMYRFRYKNELNG